MKRNGSKQRECDEEEEGRGAYELQMEMICSPLLPLLLLLYFCKDNLCFSLYLFFSIPFDVMGLRMKDSPWNYINK